MESHRAPGLPGEERNKQQERTTGKGVTSQRGLLGRKNISAEARRRAAVGQERAQEENVPFEMCHGS